MDTHDTMPSVLLFFDKQRFIFNAGEGLQRFCTEHKIKLSKIDHICLSRVCSETVGGLPGLLLTLAGMGDGLSVNIWGPSNLNLLVDAMKCFIPHHAMVHTNLISHTGPLQVDSFHNCASVASNFKDVKISAILLQPNGVEDSDVKPSDVSVIYVCELNESKGKFHKEKADALGIKVKTKFRELTEGKSVKSDLLDITVHPSDVMGAPVPGPVVIIVDCPTDSHAQKLTSTQSLNDYYSDSSCQSQSCKIVNCVIHLGPASVVSSSHYKKWMNKFSSAQHVMAGYAMNKVQNPILKSSARITTRLSYLCPQLFPLMSSTSDHDFTQEACFFMLDEVYSLDWRPLFILRPHARLGLDRSDVPSPLAASAVIDELLLEIPDIIDATQHVSQLWQKPTATNKCAISFQDSKGLIDEPILDENSHPCCLENIRRDDLEITFLGTGSSQPSKYRNVTAIYFNLFSNGSLLLDCGEGTLAQLKRRYGSEGAENAVRHLACVWISHIHADHHVGLVRILTLRRDLLKGVPHDPLIVIGPSHLNLFLDAYQRLEDLDMQFLDNKSTTVTSWETFNFDNESNKTITSTSCLEESCLQGSSKRMKLSIPIDNVATSALLTRLKKVLNKAGLERIISFPVVHCPEAFGVILKAADRINSVGKVIPGWKVVYSGDTRPCSETIEASEGAAILIHEATFEDGMAGEAIAKNHSTTKEAIDVGNSADAYRIILTHFSQRYPKIPVLDELSMHKTCIAFDLMTINIADLHVLPEVIPYLKLLFRTEMLIDDSDDHIVEADL
ncbi:F-box/WD repeat-containing protein 7-like [Hibiscus syriacus]|uniref:ribonuclease Z n=1 Tax=Hibiscus syriacus TaxID=106335 RepID=A0A6A3AK04_HIBSY|nr:F-box/WD repeat-containing protein 7-like [Hibiscus syriacus]